MNHINGINVRWKCENGYIVAFKKLQYVLKPPYFCVFNNVLVESDLNVKKTSLHKLAEH